jgi:hypothetical protein
MQARARLAFVLPPFRPKNEPIHETENSYKRDNKEITVDLWMRRKIWDVSNKDDRNRVRTDIKAFHAVELIRFREDLSRE